MLLAAGRATRLGALSQHTPKVLHKLGDEVLLDRLVRQLREVEVDEILINTHHLASVIHEHIAKRSDRRTFRVSYEPKLLRTLGSIRSNLDFFGASPAYILHADNFIEGSLKGLRETYEERPLWTWGAMLTFSADHPQECGVVEKDAAGVLTGFHEKVASPPTSEASAATFIFAPEILGRLSQLAPLGRDLSRDLLPHLLGRLAVCLHNGAVVDIGTPDGLKTALALATN